MSIPLLTYPPKSQNQRVNGFEVPGDEQPRIYSTDNLPSSVEMDALIQSAYRQIYNEQQMVASNRQHALESQLRSGHITVKQFIRGLAISDSFRRLTFDTNNNYRFAQICIQRILGREVYNEREKIAWSIAIATKGLAGFIDDLLSSDEYINNFGEHIVPYQRRRVLPQRAQGDLPFARMARYDKYHLAKLPKPYLKGFRGPGSARLDYVRWDWQRNPSKGLTQIGAGLVIGGAAFVGFLFLAVLLGF
jgi:phycobilisome rod-core linker protein